MSAPIAMKENATSITVSETQYLLDEFGREEYRDPVVPVQILMVMMGFAIQSINNVFQDPHWNLINGTGIVCGIAYLLAYMFYLAEYYDRLWEPFFLLAEDKIFFRFYSILVGLVVIAFMTNWPQYWGGYVLVLFGVMFAKKRVTRNAYREAVRAKFGSFEACTDNKIKAKYRLAEAFTQNFLVWGVWFFVPFAVVMAASLACHVYGLHSHVPYLREIPLAAFQWIYVGTSIFITTLTIFFWKNKITRGILDMRKHAERGDYEYFERM